ncbi:MAG: hypothetical protein ACI9PP_001795 [Halobacteriales archaeon]|jgi:hypothetical protein
MNRGAKVGLLAVIVGLSLVGAPVTMADWGEQAVFSVDPIEESAIDEETPILRYDSLSPSARGAVKNAIESPDSYHIVYGTGDQPDRFMYSDYSAPGSGLYPIVYEGQYYRLRTHGGGGFPFIYWIMEFPFVCYGVALVSLGARTKQGVRSVQTALVATAAGLGFHLLGPEFDFPLLDPLGFVALGLVAALGLVGELVWTGVRELE